MHVLRQEMSIGYFDKIHRPGEKLGVDDNISDFECCTTRTHANCMQGTGFMPPVVWNEEKQQYILDTDAIPLEERLNKFHNKVTGKFHAVVKGGGQNNVFHDGVFGPSFIEFKQRLPQALMQDIHGRYIELHDKDVRGGQGVPMAAIDDPTLLNLFADQLAFQAEHLKGCHYCAGYVLGAEVTYPEHFGLGYGDYRPTSWKHFVSWCKLHQKEVPTKEQTCICQEKVDT